MASRTWPVPVVIGLLTGALAIACNAVLGLDAPSLARCADGCVDGSVDEGAGEDAVSPGDVSVSDVMTETSTREAAPDAPLQARDGGDGAAEAQADASPPPGSFRCGGGAYPTSWCVGATPLCCQAGTAAAPTFTCVANAAACSGYAIECANENDCPGQDICCRFVQHQVCDVLTNCPNDEIVCQTDIGDSCPAGYTCDVPFVGDAAASSAYLGCSQ